MAAGTLNHEAAAQIFHTSYDLYGQDFSVALDLAGKKALELFRQGVDPLQISHQVLAEMELVYPNFHATQIAHEAFLKACASL